MKSIDLKFKLKAEHSKKSAVEIAEYLMQHPTEFDAYLSFLESEDELLHQRAAWPLQTVMDRAPQLFIPYYKRLLRIAGMDKHPAVRRNIMRIFQFTKVKADLLEDLLVLAIPWLKNPKEPVAIRVYSMQAIYTNCQDYPELLEELALIIENAYSTGSKGFQSRARSILDKLETKLNR